MKRNLVKFVSVILAVVLMIWALGSVGLCADGGIKVMVDGKPIVFPDASPYFGTGGRILVPVRYIGESLGAKVDWDQTSKTATLTREKDVIKVTIGQSSISVNGSKVVMDTVAEEAGGRIFVPVRYIAEGLSATVNYDSATKTVFISSKGGAANPVSNPVPADVDYSKRVVSIGNIGMVIRDDNTLWGWGTDDGKRLGLAYSGMDGAFIASPAKIMDNAKMVVAGESQILVIKTDGSLWGWGGNMPGVGEDRMTFSFNPKKIMDDVVDASCGNKHALAVKKDGSLWAWGSNTRGQIFVKQAYDSQKQIAAPITAPVKLMDGVKRVFAQGDGTYVLKKDGTLIGWNTGVFGYTSEKDANGHDTCVFDRNVKSMYANSDLLHYIKNDDTLWEMTKSNGIMTQIDKNIQSPTIGMTGSIVLKKDGTLIDRESSFFFDQMLGRKFSDYKEGPCTLMTDVKAYSWAGMMLIIMRNDGSVYSWGPSRDGTPLVKQSFSTDVPQLFQNDTVQQSQLLSDWIKQLEASGEISGYQAGAKADWTGAWDDNVMRPGSAFTNSKDGTKVLGYDYQGELIVTASADGNRLRGVYRASGGDFRGIFELALSADGNSFKGYLFFDNSAEPILWTGQRSNN